MGSDKTLIKDVDGDEIFEGDKFFFDFLDGSKPKFKWIRLLGSFCWSDEELRFEIDIHENSYFIVLSYNPFGGRMKNFKKQVKEK